MDELENKSTGLNCTAITKKVCLTLGVFGAGAVAMYLLDPERGRSRRTQINDQLNSKVNHLVKVAGSKSRHLRNRAQGVVHDLGLYKTGANSATH